MRHQSSSFLLRATTCLVALFISLVGVLPSPTLAATKAKPKRVKVCKVVTAKRKVGRRMITSRKTVCSRVLASSLTKTTTAAAATGTTTATATQITTWGVTINMFPFPSLFDDARFHEVADEQIQALKDLHVNTVRLTYAMDAPSRAAYMVKRLHDEGFKVYLILEDYVNGPQANEYQHGVQFASDVVGRVGQYVDYYQLANEIGGSAIKGSQYDGTTLDQYDPDKLNQTLDFVSGESFIIGQWAPTAKRVININSLNTGIIQAVINHGIQFEVIGWNWFSDFGTNLDTKDDFAFAKTLQSFGKELWVTELSRRGGDSDGNEAAQADFLGVAVPIAQAHNFTGVFAFLLLEDVVGTDGAGYGLVQPSLKNGVWHIDWHRQAFDRYRDLIQKG